MHGPLGQSLEWEAQQAQGSGLRWGWGVVALLGTRHLLQGFWSYRYPRELRSLVSIK